MDGYRRGVSNANRRNTKASPPPSIRRPSLFAIFPLGLDRVELAGAFVDHGAAGRFTRITDTVNLAVVAWASSLVVTL